MAIHSSVLAWRTPGTGEPGGLPSMGSHRVGHDWSDLAAAAAARLVITFLPRSKCLYFHGCSHHVQWFSVQFSWVAPSCATVCDPMNRSTAGLPLHHQLPEFTKTHVHRVRDAISSSVVPFSSCPQSFPASRSFPVSQLFAWGGQSIGISTSTSVISVNTQDWSLLGWTGWISLQS